MSAEPLHIWVVDDDESVRWVLTRALEQAGMRPRGFERADALFDALQGETPDVLITDIRMPDVTGLALMERLKRERHRFPIIVVTAYSDLDSAVAAYRGGAFEYLPKPFDIDEAVDLVRRAAAAGNGAGSSPEALTAYPSIIGRAPAMQEVFRAIGRLSSASMTVLITGESGTGKELVARALHDNSPRSDAPFVALNTSAIPSELLESELFGHEKGAFTGAESRRIGRFEQADGGTLFLDEIGDMSPALQTRLLRVLAEREFYRVGGQSAIRVDVRVIAATHRDLARAVSEGRFREDLFHRLNVMRIQVPPLRERREDIPALLRHYLARAADELSISPKRLTLEAEQAMSSFDWPGNVRELVNACRRMTVLAPGNEIRIEDIPAEFGGSVEKSASDDWTQGLSAWADARLAGGQSSLLDEALPALERTLIRVALKHVRGRRQDAAKLLGWGRNTLTRKMRELGLD